jgi:hypothetical protein
LCTTRNEIVELLQDALGSQAEKLKRTPDRLDEIVAMAMRMQSDGTAEPTVVHEVIEFTLPDGWSDDFNRALKRINRKAVIGEIGSGISGASGTTVSCLSWLVIALIVVAFAQLF